MGMVMNIQRFCLDDGPGIRTTVFLSGCAMKCMWCHNPESWELKGKLLYYPEKCIACGRCAAICRCHIKKNGIHLWNSNECIACGRCSELSCGALQMSACEYSSKEVLDIVMRDQRYYSSSGGGVTFSGGEPMLQFDFLKEMLKSAKEKQLHVCLETSGFAPTEHYMEIMEYVDLFLYDYKMTDNELHKKYTGVSNKLILSNLEMLNRGGAKIILRCIIIPTINDNDEHFKAIGKLADMYEGIQSVHIEPYHDMGNSKRVHLGEPLVLQELKIADKKTKEEYLKKIITKKTCIL